MGLELHPEREAGAATSPFAAGRQEPSISPQLQNVLPAAAATTIAAPATATTPATTTAATPQQKPFGKMTDTEKARSLTQVMESSAGTLKANGVSKHVEEMLAGVMMNEGGTNTRRVTLSNYFNNMMTGGKGGGLLGQLDKAGIERLKSDPAALEKFQKGLSEDQRFMVSRAMSGQLDLEGLNSDDKDRKAAARDQVTNAGVDLRTQQYDEMTALYDKKKGGAELSKEEQARLTQLGNIGGNAMGFDRLDRRKGVGDATMKDVRGVSSDRFREIYEDSQARFEPTHYRQWRDQYEKQTAENAKLPPDKQKPISMSSGVGSYTANDQDKAALAQNYDSLADWNTSYGTAQVMGLYAHNGALKAKDSAGKPINFDVDQLKAASRRKNPNEEDVQLLLGELIGKDMKVGSNTLGTDVMTSQYNGARKQNTANWDTYHNRLDTNIGTYQKAEAARAKEKRPAAGPNANYAD